MEKLERIYLNRNMSWKKVIIISVITGIIVGLLMIPGFLKDTSFQDPGTTFEFWILWALFIILNCRKPFEAGLKTFIAFLISQPVIYLVQVPFSWRGWEIFSYYKYWFVLTILTFPGGMLAWYVKKGNGLSVAIISLANGLLCLMIPYFIINMLNCFPHHLLAIIFMICEIVFFNSLLFKDRKLKIWAFAISALMLAASSVYYFVL